MITRLSMKVSTRIAAVFVVVVLTVPAIAFAQWREPDQAPPQGNVPRPLNQGTQFIGEASSTSFVTGAYANQGTNGSIVLKVAPCPNGQTYVANGGKWACGTAGGGNQNLLQVLTNGSDASTFTGATYFGGPLGINVASNGTLISKIQVQGDAGSWAALMGVNQTGSGALIGANIPQSGLPNLRAGIFASAAAGEWAGYFYGGQGVYIDQKLGIGTTAPTAQLDVRAAAGNRAAYLVGDVFIDSKIQFPNKPTTPNDGGNYILTTNQNADLMVMAQNNLYLIIDEQPAITGGDLVVAKDNSTQPALFIIKNNGNVGVGTPTPGAKLDVAGNVKITDGTQGAGKVLTSDATGLATWQTPVVGSGTLPTGTNDQTLRNNNGTWQATSGLTVSATGVVTTADNFSVGTVGTNPKTIVVSGNGLIVGSLAIGTLTPTAALDIGGQIKIRGGTPGAGKVLTSDANGLATWVTPASTGPWTKAGANIYPTTLTDSVGIGTVTPTRKLDITAAATAEVALSSTPAAGAGSWDGVVIQQNGAEKWYAGVKGDNANVDYVIRRNGTTNDITVQNSTGNVGIGTVTPGAKLEVAGQVKITGGVPGAGKVLTSDAAGLASWAAPAAVANLWTKTGTNVYPTTLTDNVGIGTATPRTKLETSGTIAATKVAVGLTDPVNQSTESLVVGGNALVRGVGARMYFGPDNGADPTTNPVWVIDNSANNLTNDLRIYRQVNTQTPLTGWQGLALMIEGDNGNVGIGNIPTADKLSVTGNVAVTGQVNHALESPFYINSNDGAQIRINANGGASVFGINNDANTQVLTVTNAGTVGINAPTPSSLFKLDVRGNPNGIVSQAGAIAISGVLSNGQVAGYLGYNNGTTNEGYAVYGVVGGSNLTDYAAFFDGRQGRGVYTAGSEYGLKAVNNNNANVTAYLARNYIGNIYAAVWGAGTGGQYGVIGGTDTGAGVLGSASQATGWAGQFTGGKGVLVENNLGVGIQSIQTPSQKIEVNGGIRLNTATAKPACNVNVRGTMWFTQSAAGVKDSFEVCAKDAANNYAWRTLY